MIAPLPMKQHWSTGVKLANTTTKLIENPGYISWNMLCNLWNHFKKKCPQYFDPSMQCCHCLPACMLAACNGAWHLSLFHGGMYVSYKQILSVIHGGFIIEIIRIKTINLFYICLQSYLMIYKMLPNSSSSVQYGHFLCFSVNRLLGNIFWCYLIQ